MRTNKNKHGVIEIDGKYYRLRSNGKPGVEVPYCNHTMTKAELFGRILSFARKGTKFWAPALAKLNEGRRAYKGVDKRIKWEYSCELCKGWFLRRKTKPNIEIDHIIPCGGINAWDKIVGWYQRAYIDTEGYRRLCSTCHLTKSLEER